MCGICLMVQSLCLPTTYAEYHSNKPPCVDVSTCIKDKAIHGNELLNDYLSHRGPDASQSYHKHVTSKHGCPGGYCVSGKSTVLRMRKPGAKTDEEVDRGNSIFLYNGELYNNVYNAPFDDLSNSSLSSETQHNISGSYCDTELLERKLLNLDPDPPDEILAVLTRFRGPFALVVAQPERGNIWFAVDTFGRKSLQAAISWQARNTADVGSEGKHHTIGTTNDNRRFNLALCSVVASLPHLGISEPDFTEVPSGVLFLLEMSSPCLKETCDKLPAPSYSESKCDCVNYPLLKCYPFRTYPMGLAEFVIRFPRIWFSDTMIIPSDPRLFTLNHDMDSQCVVREELTVESEDNAACTPNDYAIQQLLSIRRLQVETFLSKLQEALRVRIDHRTRPAGNQIAVLFSGGVDSLLLAALVAKTVPANETIDLLNTAFYDGRNWEPNSNGNDSTIHPHIITPDRLTGLKAFEELKTLFPNTQFRFIRVDISMDEAAAFRQRTRGLTLPGDASIIDNSVGQCLWFAARGNGRLDDGTLCESKAKVLISGTAADELLGGYARHRGRFNVGGWEALRSELEMELKRIGARNLSRDDRIAADHGKEIRTPYLDESVVCYLNSLNLNTKVDLRLRRGIGEKLLLRLSLFTLGFRASAFSPKRAFQFGSGIAKLTKSELKGK